MLIFRTDNERMPLTTEIPGVENSLTRGTHLSVFWAFLTWIGANDRWKQWQGHSAYVCRCKVRVDSILDS